MPNMRTKSLRQTQAFFTNNSWLYPSKIAGFSKKIKDDEASFILKNINLEPA